MMICNECGKETYIIHITVDYEKICDICYDKRRVNMYNLKDRFYKEGIVVDGHFELNSGKHTDKYIYKDKIYCNIDLFEVCVDALTELIKMTDAEFDCVASPSAGGVVLGSPIALNVNKPLIYGEKNPDSSFRLRKCFREFVKGKKIIIVDDIYSSGKTVYNLFDVIKEYGGELKGVFCIWNRSTQRTLDRTFSIDIKSLIYDHITTIDKEYCYQCNNQTPLTNLK